MTQNNYRMRKPGDRFKMLSIPSNFGLLSCFLAVLNSVGAQDFGYNGQKGPSHWGEQYNTCVGKYQSPIDINSLTVKHAQLPPLILNSANVLPNQTTIKNNGHTVMVSVDSDNRPTITGGPLHGTYEFAQLHFHWGENDTQGSEDLIDGQSFPMELHVVFYKKQYRNIRSAMENADGLTVLAFFFQLDDEDNENYVEITQLLGNVSEPKTSMPFQRMKSIGDLLLPKLDEYFTYHGSLTTPPCSEVVTWIDFKQPISLSHSQIQIFRTINDDEGHQLTHNFRPIQPIGDRAVYFVSSTTPDDSVLDSDQPRLDEPSQDLDSSLTNSGIDHDKLAENNAAPTVDDAVDQNANDVKFYKKLNMFGKSAANHITTVANGLILATCVILWMTSEC